MPGIPLLKFIQPFAYVIVFMGLYFAEHIYPQRRELMDRKHDRINVLIGIANLVIVGVVGYYFQEYMVWFNGGHFGLLNQLQLPAFVRIVCVFLFLVVFMYWWHRANHQIPFLWRFHAFHHADRKMNTTTALRFHIAELLFSYFARMAVFPLLGISVSGFLIYGIVFTSVVLFHHSSIRLSLKADLFLRHLIVTPHMHRIHHSVVREETDSNFSSVFSFWDSWFRSYIKTPSGPVEFGIPPED